MPGRFEVVEDEVEYAEDVERVGGAEEVVAEEVEVVEDEEVVLGPEAEEPQSWRQLLREAGAWWPLPESLEGLEKLLKRFGAYGTCLVELRTILREYDKVEDVIREVNKELRYVRTWIYVLGLKALSLVGRGPASCKLLENDYPLLAKACHYAAERLPKYVYREVARGNPGSNAPRVIMAWMRRLLPECYEIISGKRSPSDEEVVLPVLM